MMANILNTLNLTQASDQLILHHPKMSVPNYLVRSFLSQHIHWKNEKQLGYKTQ